MRHVAILAQFERLWPKYEDDYVHFGLNLSAGLAGLGDNEQPTAEERDYLKSWNWTQFDEAGTKRLAIYQGQLDDDAKIVAYREVSQWSPLPLAKAVEELGQLEGLLETELSKADLNWAPGVRQSASSASWPAMLSDMSQWPVRLSRRLRLAMIIKINAADLDVEYTHLYAAPIFLDKEPFTGARKPEALGAMGVELGVSGDLYCWPYEGADPDIKAYFLPSKWSKEPAASDRLLDPTTHWVKRPATETDDEAREVAGDVLDGDWFSDLEQRFAGVFLLGSYCIDAGLDKGAELTCKEAKKLVDATLAVFRDVAGVGLQSGADGESMAAAWLRRLGVDSGEREHVVNLLGQYDSDATLLTLSHWQAVLRNALPEQAGNELLTDDPPVLRKPAGDQDWENQQPVLRLLQSLSSALADDRALARVVLEQWRLALSGNATGLRFWSAYEQVLRTRIAPETQIRNQLLSAVLKPLWAKLTPGEQGGLGLDTLRKGAIAAAKSYLADRFGPIAAASTNWYQSALPRVDGGSGTQAMVEAILVSSVTRAFNDAVPPRPTSPTEMAHAVSFQLDGFRTSDPDAEDLEDLVRRFPGAIVLLRRSEGAWSSLNLANLRPSVNGAKPLAAGLVPSRLIYRHDARQAFATYDNQPLTSRSPASDLAQGVALAPPNGQPLGALLEYEPAVGLGEDVLTDWAKLAPLHFGSNYQALVPAATNCGALPPGTAGDGLADPVSVDVFGLWFDALGDDHPAKESVREFEYRRRVPVGSPRVRGGELEVQLPAIPAAVSPWARKLELELEVRDDKDKRRVSDQPVILLTPEEAGWSGAHEFKLTLRPPSVDAQTWLRWVMDDVSILNRAKILGEHSKRTRENLDVKPAARMDASINDPAFAEGLYHVKASLIKSDGSRVAKMFAKDVFVNAPDISADFASVQGQLLGVSINRQSGVVADDARITEPAAGNVQILVQDGEILCVEIWTGVLESKVETRCSLRVELFDKAKRHEHEGDAGSVWYRLFAPLRFAVEAAALPAGSLALDLWQALQLEWVDEAIEVRLAKDFQKTYHRWIEDIDLARQAWRWDGRVLEMFPDIGATDPNSQQVLEWEAQGFATRRDSDSLRLSATLSGDPAAALGGAPLLYRENLTTDRLARLYRFGCTVYSRYRGLTERRWTAQREVDEHVDHWKRFLAGCRIPDGGSVAKPLIKLILPLTEGPADNPATPGLLVVLNEPWYGVGGLAEQLEAQLVTAASGVHPEKTEPEAGPDAILTAETDPGFATNQPWNVRGPLGHTFDTDTEAPLLRASSFFVAPPGTDATKDPAWAFAKIRFRRTLHGPLRRPAAAPLHSLFTDGYWAQLAPDSGRYSVERGGFEERLRIDDPRLDVSLFSSAPPRLEVQCDGQEAAFLPTRAHEDSNAQFELFYLLTQPATDALGRHNQETYVGIYRVNHHALETVSTENTVRGEERILRLVEVQWRKAEDGGMPEGEIWPLLFPEASSEAGKRLVDDAQGRIVRVSPPRRVIVKANLKPALATVAEALGADLSLGQKVPPRPEAAVVGQLVKRIRRSDPEFQTLVSNTNPDIVFKNEEGTGADRVMTAKLAAALNQLASMVKSEWPGYQLRVTEAWDEDGEHSGASVHYEARAADLTISPVQSSKLGRLGRLAVDVGLEWVFYEDETHIHVSVSA